MPYYKFHREYELDCFTCPFCLVSSTAVTNAPDIVMVSLCRMERMKKIEAEEMANRPKWCPIDEVPDTRPVPHGVLKETDKGEKE